MTTLVVITGASKGIGRSIATEFAKAAASSCSTIPTTAGAGTAGSSNTTTSSNHYSSFLPKDKKGFLQLCLIGRNHQGLLETQSMVMELVSKNKASSPPKKSQEDEQIRHENIGHHSNTTATRTTIHSMDLSNLETLESNIQRLFHEVMVVDSNRDGKEQPLPSSSSPQKETIKYARAILIQNAGSLGHVGSSAYLPSPMDLRESVDLNFTSTVWISSYFYRFFGIKHGIPCNIVNISSLCAISPFPTMAMYCAVKSGREMWHKVLSLEAEKDSNSSTTSSNPRLLKVLNYAPGAVDTDMTRFLAAAGGSGSGGGGDDYDDESNNNSHCLDADLRAFYQQSQCNSTLIHPDDTARKLVHLLWSDSYQSGDHVDYWDYHP